MSSKLNLLADALDVGVQSCLYYIPYWIYTTSEVTHQINILRLNQIIGPECSHAYDIFIFGSVNYLKFQVVVKSHSTNCHIYSSEDSLFLRLSDPL